MDNDDEELGFVPGLAPALVSLTPFASSASPSPRRLSSCFTPPTEPLRSKRQLAWVSLQGRLVGADDASSAKTVDRNGAFSAEETVAWELFSPIQRVLTVAVTAAAAVNSQKNKQISKLKKSVDLRDQVLLIMQKKLDNLCEQVKIFKDQPEVETQDVFIPTECPLFNESKGLDRDAVCKQKMLSSYETEPDERRMSDLSDWAPSVASSVDFQMDSLSIEHDINSLRKESEQKDITIKELSTFLNSSQVLSSKRIAELEDIIRRKNMIINKLRKDLIVLEQKVMSLTRVGRSSFTAATSKVQHHLPKMADNLLYDMDRSSDSDSSPRKDNAISVQITEKCSKRDATFCHAKSSTVHTTFPLKEISCNQTPNSVAALKPKQTKHNASGENRSRRRPLKSKDVATHERWV